MQLEDMLVTQRMWGRVGERGGGGEGEGGRENVTDPWTKAERLGAYTRHPAPEKLSIASLLELFELKGKTNKQNKTAELERGAAACWASVWECKAGAQTLEVMLTRTLHRMFSWLPHTSSLCCSLHGGNGFPHPVAEGLPQHISSAAFCSHHHTSSPSTEDVTLLSW